MNKDKLKQEQAELNSLINEGISFYVEDVQDVPIPWYKKLFAKPKTRVVKRTFRLNELTLSTQDRISNEALKIGFDMDDIISQKDSKSINLAKDIMNKHGKTCARIVAIAVVNSSYLIKSSNGIRIPNPKIIDEYTELFYRALKPSQLFDMFKIIEIMRNLGDFTHSIRLISEATRTTAPVRIEENNLG